MRQFSLASRRWHPVRVASITLGLTVLIALAAYGFAVSRSGPTLGGLVSALALLAIAGAGLLYAWRLGAGSAVD